MKALLEILFKAGDRWSGTNITAILGVIFNLAEQQGWFTLTPEMMTGINTFIVGLVAWFMRRGIARSAPSS